MQSERTQESTAGFLEMEVLSRRYHLHWPGVVFVITTVLLALGAIQTQNNVLYIGFGIAVGSLLFSGIASGAMLMGVRLERQVEHATGVGMQLTVRYRVRNSNRIFPAFALVVEEESRIKGRTAATWSRRLSRPLLGTCVVNLEAGVSAIVMGEAPTVSRGSATFDCVRVWTTFPFGITRKSVLFAPKGDQVQTTLVRPRVVKLKRKAVSSFLSRDPSMGASTSKSGGREEFLGIRSYLPRDGQSAVAWKPSARTLLANDELLVRENASLSGRKVWLEIDPDVEDLDKAAEFAASLIFSIIGSGAAAGLRLPQAHYSPVMSVRQTGPMLDGLATLTRETLQGVPAPSKLTGYKMRIGAKGSGAPLTLEDYDRFAAGPSETTA